MATQVKHRRGNTSEIATFTPAIGELIMNTETNELILGDGATQGGNVVNRAQINTVAVLKTRPLKIGDVIQTASYNNIFDNGGGTYVIEGPQSVDGFGDHTLDNGNVAKLITNSVRNIAQYGAVNSLSVDSTANIQAAIDALLTYEKLHIPAGFYAVSKATMLDKVDCGVSGFGAIVGVSDNPFDSVLELRNCTGITSEGRVTISASAKTNYDSAVKIWAETGRTSSLHTLNFNITNAKVGWWFGDVSAPDQLLSEIVISKGYTFNTPVCAVVYGSQAVIEFAGYQLVSNGTGGLASELHKIIDVTGGVVHVNGGEMQMPAVVNGYGTEIRPINSPGFSNRYGSVQMVGVALECASLWSLLHNPNAVPSVEANSGVFAMTQCTGFANFSGVNVQGGADFSGKVVIDDTCDFHRSSVHAQATVDCQGGAKVLLGDNFNVDGFMRTGLYGINRGIPKYSRRKILEVTNLNSLNVPQSVATTMVFTSIASTPENAHYTVDYNTTTGVFTVPEGGLKNLTIHIEANSIAARPNSEIGVVVNGSVPKGQVGNPSKYINGDFDLGKMNAGDTVEIRYTNLDVTFNFGATGTDKISFIAEN